MLSERWIWGTFVKRRMLRGRQSFSTISLQEKVCLWVETLLQTQSAGVQKTCQSHTWANLSESYQVSSLSGFCQGLWSLQTSIKGLHVSLRSALSVNVSPLRITWLVLLIWWKSWPGKLGTEEGLERPGMAAFVPFKMLADRLICSSSLGAIHAEESKPWNQHNSGTTFVLGWRGGRWLILLHFQGRGSKCITVQWFPFLVWSPIVDYNNRKFINLSPWLVICLFSNSCV